jgi:hypothetical protein
MGMFSFPGRIPLDWLSMAERKKANRIVGAICLFRALQLGDR